MKKIILASASPRRKELLSRIVDDFEIDPSGIEEDLSLNCSPHELARILATHKAHDVAQRHSEGLILAADTLVTLDGKVFGKPAHSKEALEMLQVLNGNAHQVITGFTWADVETGRAVVHSVVTLVQFKDNSLSTLEAYVKTDESFDKAGAYAIQGEGGKLVERIEGDYNNVVGLPLEAVKEALKNFIGNS